MDVPMSSESHTHIYGQFSTDSCFGKKTRCFKNWFSFPHDEAKRCIARVKMDVPMSSESHTHIYGQFPTDSCFGKKTRCFKN